MKLVGTWRYAKEDNQGGKHHLDTKVQIYFSNKVVIDMDSDVEINTSGMKVLNLLLRYPDKIDRDERVRLQFQGKLLNKKANFIGYGAAGNLKQVDNKRSFKLSRFSNHYIGYIMDEASSDMCDFSNCEISVVLQLKDVSHVKSYCRVVPKISKLLIDSYDFDIIRGDGNRVYLYSPTDEEDVIITVIPIESDVKLYAHPASLPNDLENSTWKMHTSLAKRLIITAVERKKL